MREKKSFCSNKEKIDSVHNELVKFDENKIKINFKGIYNRVTILGDELVSTKNLFFIKPKRTIGEISNTQSGRGKCMIISQVLRIFPALGNSLVYLDTSKKEF